MRLKDYLINENIFGDNPDDPSDPQVNIHGGGGVMLLSQVERNVREKVADIAQTAAKAKDAEDWNRVKGKIENDWMLAAIDTIIAARKELEGRE